MTQIAETTGRKSDGPFFSICIPQYNRTAFLIEACKSLAQQTYKDFEVCISDDRSTDGKEAELLSYLQQSGLSFIYRKQEHNCRYDGNLRASIDLSRGQYCFLLGNDDGLVSPNTLQELYDDIQQFGPMGAVITNFEDFATGKPVRRMRQTGVIGAGPVVAANHFRNVSFVSGVVLNGERARALSTSKWDGSEMYQMYLMCRIVAEGGLLLGIDRVAIRKDIQIPGEMVDSHISKPRLKPCPIIERQHTFHLLGRLVADAIEPYLSDRERQPVIEKVLHQILLFTYPFWVFEYRRIQSWNYAAGICLGMKPRHLIKGICLSRWRKARIAFLYAIVSLLGLTIPASIFHRLYPRLHALAKSKWGRRIAGAQYAGTA